MIRIKYRIFILFTVFASSGAFAQNADKPADTEVVSVVPASGVVRITNTATQLAVNGGENHGGAPVSSAKLRREWASQRWEVEALDDGSFRLMNEWTGLYLSSCSQHAFTELCVQEPVKDWSSQRWYFERVKENRYRLRNAWSNLYMQGAGFEWTSLTQVALEHSSDTQIFEIETISHNL